MIFRPVMLALAALLLAGNAAPDPARIEFVVKSWGKLVADWRIDAGGKAVFTYSEGPGLGTYKLHTKRFDAGREGYARIRTLLAKVEAAVGHAPSCGGRATDFPYGEVAWVDGGGTRKALSFDMGCQGKEIVALHHAMRAADKQMAEWAKPARIAETREANA